MVDSSHIRRDVGLPYGPEEPRNEAKVDPDKFKKVLKIDESDEAQKRNKRRLKKEEEEGEETEDVQTNAPSPPPGSFSEYLQDKDEVSNLFDKESPGIQKRSAFETPLEAPPPGMISTEGVELEEESPLFPQKTVQFQKTPLEEEPPLPPSEPSSTETYSYTPFPEEEPPISEGIIPQPEEGQAPPPKQPDQKEKDTSLFASQPEKNALKKTSKKKKAEPTPRVEITPSKGKKADQLETLPEENGKLLGEKIPEKETPTTIPEVPKATFERFTPQKPREKTIEKTGEATPLIEGFEVPMTPESEMGMMGEGQKKKEEDFPFIDTDQITANFPAYVEPLSSATPPQNVPAYANLTPEVFELFERIAGTVMIQQQGGITTTTVTINMPNTVFQGSQIVLDHYSTAPNAFNVQLIGSPEAVTAFNNNIDDLVAAFKQGQFAFEVNLLKPVLEAKKPLIRRKGAAGDKGGQKK